MRHRCRKLKLMAAVVGPLRQSPTSHNAGSREKSCILLEELSPSFASYRAYLVPCHHPSTPICAVLRLIPYHDRPVPCCATAHPVSRRILTGCALALLVHDGPGLLSGCALPLLVNNDCTRPRHLEASSHTALQSEARALQLAGSCIFMISS